MKNFLILFIAVLSLISYKKVSAQVSAYTFSQGTGTFTALTATYTQHTSGTTDNATYNAVNIGFTFCYNGVNYTQVSICNDGFIALGGTVSQSYTPLSGGASNNVISAYSNDLQGLSTGSLRSKMTGTAPNRQFTVEWQHYEDYGGVDDYSWQIILTETTNLIEIVYDASSTVASNFAQVGLRGASNADFNNRTKATGTAWTASTAGVANTDLMETGSNAAKSPNGKFTWTPPAACSGTPANGTTTTSASSVCSGATVDLAVTGSTNSGCGLTFQWQSSTDNSTWSNIAGATASTYTPTITSALYFRRITSCNGTPNTGSSGVQVTLNSAYLCSVCASSATSTSDMDITNITFGTINNTSATVSLTGTQGTATGTAGMYSKWTNSSVPVPSFQQSTSNAFSVTIGGSAYSHRVDVYIDFNHDGDFLDAGESTPIFTYANPALPNTTASSISIPSSATLGLTYMRVVCVESSSSSSCGTYSWGETEDYLIDITAAPVCSGSPTGGTATASITSATCSTNSTITAAGYTTGVSGISLQWQSSPNNSTWTDIAGATSASYAATGISATTYYHLVVTCSNGGAIGTSTTATVTINPVVAGTSASTSASVCSATSFTMSLSGNTTTGVTYQWQSSPDNSAWTNIAGATSATYVTTQSVATYYRCVVTCTASSVAVNSTSTQVTMAAIASCYCSSTSTGSSSFFDDFSTSGGTTNINNNNSNFSAGGYGDFTSEIVTQIQGSSVNFNTTLVGTTVGVRIWVDWNQDGDFNDAGEQVYTSGGYVSTSSGSFTVPMTALVGATRMRIRLDFGDTTPEICGSIARGETEDYTFVVTAIPACAGAPAGGTATASVTSATCSTTGVVLTAAGYTSGVTGISLQWQSSPDGSTWTNIAGATAATYTTGTVSATTYYHCNVTCSNSGTTTASTTASITINPVVGGTTVSSSPSVCSATTFTLSMTGNTTTGVTYQWQSSPDGVTWTNITGATASTRTVTQSAATYYHCNVTCTASASTVASSSLLVNMSAATNCYCSSGATNTGDEEIYSVTVNGSTNTYNCTTVAPGPGSILNRYSNFTTLAPLTSIQQGNIVAFSISEDECDGATYFNNGCSIWIDYNQDGDFIDAGEQVFVEATTSISPRTISGNFTVPGGALTGVTRMRITVSEGNAGTALTPCLSYGYGETEDYNITITAAPLCAGTPAPGTASSSIASFCNTGTPILSTSGYTTGVSGITFQWYQSATTGPYAWSQIPGATAASYSSPTISQTTYYYCEVTCSSNSAATNTVTVTNGASQITSTNTPVTVTCGTAASLTATASGGGTIKWYTAATGGTAVATGSPYAPTVSANTTYYCTSSTAGGGNQTFGRLSGTYNTGDGTAAGVNKGIRFDALSPFTLVSVDVYAAAANTTVKVQLQDNTGTNIGSAITVNNLAAGWNTIPLNLSIPTGTGYRLVKTNNNNALGRSTTGTTFPYTLAGICSLTSSEVAPGTSTANYFFFYNWVVSTACESNPRTPVDVFVTGATPPVCSGYSYPTNAATNICPVSATIDWLISNTACRAATSYLLYFGTDAAATNIMNGVDVGNVLTYNLGTLAGGTTYYWKIVPTNAGGPATGCAIQSFGTAANPGTICPGLLGTGVIPVASLPYASGAGTTAGAGDDLTSTNVTNCGSTSYLTGEDQVFYFTPTTSGTITINLTTTTGTYTGLMLYDGCPLNTATCGAAVGSCVANAQGYTGNKTMNVCVIANTTYYLILDSWASPTSNPYSNLTISAVTPLAIATNDLPCNANPMTLGVTENGNNSCTSSASEPNAPSCWTTGTRNTVWYSVVAPASGQLSVRTMLGSLLNTQIALYQGVCSSFTQVAPTSSTCNDNLAGCGSSEASQMNVTGLTPGTIYYIVVDGGNDLTGTFQIVVIDPSTQSFPSTPGQDCSIAFPTCNSVLMVSDPGYANTGSTCDFDGSDDCTSGERSSVWYNIVIGTNGFLTFDLYPNDYGGPGSGAGGETDYDFLVWKTGGAGATTCTGIQTNSATGLVACNFSYLGVTGVSDAAGNTPAFFSPDNFDAAYEPRIPVLAGEQYTIVIQNYTGSTSGFTIDYTGSGSAINYAPSASILNWSGTSSTAWTLPANWGGCAIPACGVSAVVGALVPNFPTISTNQSVNNLTIDAGATLTINAGITLTVCGNFVNNGTLIMAPTATLLFNNTAAHTISGNLTGTNAIGNITVTQTAGSVTFMSDIDIAGNLTTSTSTSIINSNNKYVKLAGNFVNATGNTTYTNTGTVGTLEFNGTAAQTYNQGSTQLDLNNVVMNHTSTGVTLLTNMYVKSTTGTLTLTAGKITTNAFEVNVANTTPACVTTGNATSYVNGNLRRYLAAGATGSFDFPVGNTANYERANINFTSAAAAGAINLLSRFDAWGGTWSMPGAPGWGPECAVTYNQPFLNNGYWSIDASAASTGLYNMTAYNTGYTNAAAGWSIAKSPSVAPTWTLQGTCQAGPVTAVVRNAMSGFSKFATIQSSSVLPIQLLSFNGANKNTFNELVWETASEEKVIGFELESSANAVDFKMIHARSANGATNHNSNYKFNDNNFFSPVSYYRLKIINDDNTHTYSSVIAIENKQKSQLVTKIFPNPAINEVNVSMEIPFDTEMRMEIKDLLGRVVYSKTMNVSAGNQEFNINTQELSQGTYVISTYIDNLPETNNKLVISK